MQEFMGRAASGQLSPFLSRPRAKVDEIVGLAHHQRMMADDDCRMAPRQMSLEGLDQLPAFAEAEAAVGFVKQQQAGRVL